MSRELIVIGGGAAGFFCAVNAARMNPGLRVTILEKTNKLLSKVKVSGGGRCNVTHACFDRAEMSRKYPRGGHFVKKAFHRFFTTDTIGWFEERGVYLKTEDDGRMFPVTDSSQTIIDCLLRDASRLGVEIRMLAEVREVAYEKKRFQLSLSDHRTLSCDFVCVACGGFAKTSMFEWLRKTGHSVEEPVPSLFTFNLPGHPITRLMGVSVEKATVKINDSKLEEQGPLLITHWGLSGPAVLRLSAWGARFLKERNWHFEIRINWVPSFNEQTLREKFQYLRTAQASHKIFHKNPLGLPQRLWEYLAHEAGCQLDMRWADLPAKGQNLLVKTIVASEYKVSGKTTFKEEFVTAGGIRLSEVNPNTMESKLLPHLFFAGEILDVDGITGGFNFQHAWTSGWIAAEAIGQYLLKTE